MFTPPHPVKKFYYRCDRKFHLDDLLKLYETHENYAIVLISGKRTEFYLHNTNVTKLLKGIDERIQNQHKTGGQSAQRFGRLRDEQIGGYVKKIVEMMVQFYIKSNVFQCKGLVIAGPAEMKDMVRDNELFVQHFGKHLLKTLTVAEITDNIIYQVINSAADVLTSESEENNLITDFEAKLTDPNQMDLLVFSTDAVINAYNSGHLKEIYVSDKFKDKIEPNSKTILHIIRSNNFTSKFGDLIGIQYYASNSNGSGENSNDTDDVFYE